ncbi:MAG: chromophore lyase CpcT/CpeT [Cyanobacteria bacterium P01_F01_bin.53]
MSIQKAGRVIFISLWLGLAGPLQATANPQREESALSSNFPSELSVEAVAAHLEGVMDTTAQADNNPDFVGVQMTTCRITVMPSITDDSTEPGSRGDVAAGAAASSDSIYLYQEQALSENVAEPYRQRFLHILPGDNHRIDSRTFKPDDPEQYVDLCDQSAPVAAATDLGEHVCTVSLRASAIGGFVGSTPAEGCPASLRGAVRITNVVVLHAAGMDTWDRGFDADGNQLWGAKEIPYQYRW